MASPPSGVERTTPLAANFYDGCEFDDEDDDSILGSDDDDVVRPTTYTTGLNKQYVSSWTRADAFREFYQNWKDALVATFNLDPRSFAPKWEESSSNEIRITVHRSVVSDAGEDVQELLGYIYFNKKTGSLELANFQAKLEMRHLSIGGTTKRDERFAGVHGEGFKLAALVMCRNYHGVRISSSSFYWNFGFRGQYQDRFCCRLTQASPDKIQKQKALAKEKEPARRTKLTSYIWRDVTVRIAKRRGDYGQKVTENDFRSWSKVAIDLSGPSEGSIIRTPVGDLILDHEFSGRIYLKGLRVHGHGPDGRSYVYGYNFAQGYINRDRERLTDKLEEARMLGSIWEHPILDGQADITRRYIKLFQDHEDSPDVALAETVVSLPASKVIWDQLKTDQPDAFFYCENKDDSSHNNLDSVHIIVANLKKQPEKISRPLWKLFRKHSLVRTPEEQRIKLFSSSEKANVANDIFSASVSRLLRAALQLDQRLAQVRIQAVKGGETGIDTLFKPEENLLLIHEDWLDFNKTHESATCELSQLVRETSVDVSEFSCDHILDDLMELVINDVRGHVGIDHSEALSIRRLARERIRQTPRKIRTHAVPADGELRVTWMSNESGLIAVTYGHNILYDVTLHRMSCCQQNFEELLHRDETEVTTPCGCDRQIVSQNSCNATFSHLDHTEEYFPMVARTGAQTFFGKPPPPRKPRAPQKDAVVRAPGTAAVEGLLSGCVSPLDQGSSRAKEGTSIIDLTASHSDNGDDTMDDEADFTLTDNHDNNDFVSDDDQMESVTPTGNPSRHQDVVVGEKTAQITESIRWQDEMKWRSWHEVEWPEICSRLFPSPYKVLPSEQCKFSEPSFDLSVPCPHLDCSLETGTYVRIREISEGVPDYIAFIHDIHKGEGECSVDSAHLKATVYSSLKSDYLFRTRAPASEGDLISNASNEVFLHFSSVTRMGTAEDSAIITIADIAEAHPLLLDYEVFHCDKPPPDIGDDSNPFCRFAIGGSLESGVTIMPLESGLVSRRRRRKLETFDHPSNPTVLDLTPDVLGPLEGFVELGSSVLAGIGFDEGHHMTWRARYPRCPVFDGPPSTVFNDFVSEKLPPLDFPSPRCPRVALVVGENSDFRLSLENEDRPTAESFLAPLDTLDSATSSTLEPDFSVLIMPSTLLHDLVIGRFSRSLLGMLEQGQSVRIMLFRLEAFDLPQRRSVITVIGSLYPGLSRLSTDTLNPTQFYPLKNSKKVGDCIGDLNFGNPRGVGAKHTGFVCRISAPGDENRIRNVYNHLTGLGAAGKEVTLVEMEKDAVVLSYVSPELLVHADRRDLLTVREIARLQGFKDEFLFYGMIQSQYMDVMAAQPPVIGKVLAELICKAARPSRKVEFGEIGASGRVNKRARVEIGEPQN